MVQRGGSGTPESTTALAHTRRSGQAAWRDSRNHEADRHDANTPRAPEAFRVVLLLLARAGRRARGRGPGRSGAAVRRRVPRAGFARGGRVVEQAGEKG